MTLSISWEWLSSLHETPEVRQTSAKLKLVLGQQVLTRNVDEWSQTVSDDVRMSAYPLALWLASNWWRLRWEPLPPGEPSLSWRMSHEIAAAGYGCVWPRVLMASDGESIQVWAEPTSNRGPAPVKYLNGAHGVMSAEEFERSIDHFLDGVLARLNAVGIGNSELHELCREISEERTNAELARYRRLEAIAGFDAGEGPDEVLGQLESLVPEAGINAVQEIAVLCATSLSDRALADAVRLAREPGLQARPNEVVADERLVKHIDRGAPAWVRGTEIARTLRHRLALNGRPISDNDLCAVMGVSEQALHATDDTSIPLGLAVRQDREHLSLHLRRRPLTARRFELARFLSDHATAEAADRWLPVTDGKTSRQKLQRAFAAELLCPVEALRSYLGDDFSEDAIEAAAAHFGVGTLAVQSQLVNNHILPRNWLLDFEGQSVFPYPLGSS
jgi:hypothetical protein